MAVPTPKISSGVMGGSTTGRYDLNVGGVGFAGFGPGTGGVLDAALVGEGGFGGEAEMGWEDDEGAGGLSGLVSRVSLGTEP